MQATTTTPTSTVSTPEWATATPAIWPPARSMYVLCSTLSCVQHAISVSVCRIKSISERVMCSSCMPGCRCAFGAHMSVTCNPLCIWFVQGPFVSFSSFIPMPCVLSINSANICPNSSTRSAVSIQISFELLTICFKLTGG